MTNLQLLLSIGIPSILVMLAWLSNNARLSAHDKRFDDVISAQHKDALEIMRNITALHERVAVVEVNQARRA
jgi:hypothetical protein